MQDKIREDFEKWYGGNHDNSTGIAEQLKEARWEAWQAASLNTKQASEELNKLIDASERMMFLHMCEQEGIICGQPSPKEWFAAVDYLGQALEPFRKAAIDETKEQVEK